MQSEKSMLSRIWAAWKRFGQAIGNFVARIVLTIFYYTIFVPFGLITSMFQDPLDIKGDYKQKSGWVARESGDKTLEEAQRMS